MARLNAMSLLADAKYKQLSDMYGDDPAKWKLAGAATLIGADIAEGYSKWAENTLKARSIDKRQNEISARADISITNLLKAGDKVVSSQATAFVKSGVKLEGSAMNVMSETLEQAGEAARVRRREADFEISQMEVQKALAKTRADFAPFETALNIGMSAVSSGVFSGSGATKPTSSVNPDEFKQFA